MRRLRFALVVALDVAVVGGGLQGLVLLRELTSAGYRSVLVTKADLGSGQTLHSHGLLNSGTGLVTGALKEELHEFTLPYLRHLGVAVYGEDRSFLLLPDQVVAQLTPAWEANQYRPEITDSASLPPGFDPIAPVYRVHGFNVDKRRLLSAISAGLERLLLRGEVIDAGDKMRVRTHPSGEMISLEPRAVVVAAGCGTTRLLRGAFGIDEDVLDRITYTKLHMICLRGPRAVLPEIGTLVSPQLMIVGHPSPGHFASQDQVVTWYVTPAIAAPPRYAEAPDDAVADVEAPLVASAIEALVRLVPSLSRDDTPVEATVFAGYKQDFEGQPTRRACEVVDRERNVIMALPSVIANAVPNAIEVLSLIHDRLGRSAGAPEVRLDGGVAVGQPNEDVDPKRWTNWTDFAHAY